MKPIEYRHHDGHRYRIWSEEDTNYGCFHIVTRDQLRLIIRANRLMGVVVRPAEDAHMDPIDMIDYRPEDGLSDEVLRLESIGSS